MGKSGPRLFRCGCTINHLNADTKILFAGKTAGEIECILEIPRAGKCAGQHRIEPFARGQLAHEARIE